MSRLKEPLSNISDNVAKTSYDRGTSMEGLGFYATFYLFMMSMDMTCNFLCYHNVTSIYNLNELVE